MTDGRCAKLLKSGEPCPNIGIYQVCIELYPPSNRGYDGGPAQLFFQDLLFCEEHAKEVIWQDLIYPEQITGVFEHLGKVVPDFNRTQVRLFVAQGAEVV
jgi:hypothetical protein